MDAVPVTQTTTDQVRSTDAFGIDAAASSSGHADIEVTTDDGQLVQEELLVEEVSIDGMCGVY